MCDIIDNCLCGIIMNVNSFISIGLIACVFAGGLFSPAWAQTDEANEAKHRVDIAGRQRMLSQRMTKAACFIVMGVDVEAQKTALKAAMDTFARTRKALEIGDEEMGLSIENNPAVLVELAKVDDDWITYSALLDGIFDGTTTDAGSLAAIDAEGSNLLYEMNTAVGVISSKYGAKLEELPAMLATTINLAGRQRMFTQKAAKEACLIEAGVDPEGNIAHLTETLSYFNATLEALQVGLAGTVASPPNDEIKAKLQEVRDLWTPVNEILTGMTQASGLTDVEKLAVATGVDKVLKVMDEAVHLYDDVDGTDN